MSIETICNEIAEKIGAVKQKGYEEGFAAGQASGGGDMSAWWKAFFDSQKELAQIGTFGSAGWNEQTFTPDRTICAESLGTSNANSLFGRSGFEIFPEFLSDGVTLALNTEGFSTMGSIFSNCAKLKRIEAVLDMKICTNMTTAFAGSLTKPCPLEYVKLKNVQKCSNWTSAFNYCPALTDIGQESDDFGYFSTSVNLSQTAINFGTNKMAIFSFYGEQDGAWLKILGDNDVEQTLTISSAQYQQTVDYALSEGAPEDTANEYFSNIVAMLGWKLAVV